MNGFIAIFTKDIKLIFSAKKGILEPLLLGLIFIFTFSLASSNLGKLDPVWTGSIFWICSLFCSVLIFRELYRVEETHNVIELIMISPISIEIFFIAKTIVGVITLIFVQMFFMLLMTVFLKLNGFYYLIYLLPVIILADWGIGIISSFFGGAIGGTNIKDSFITTILFPMQIPLLLGGIKIWENLFNTGGLGDSKNWINLIISFDGIFTGICLFLFPFLFSKR